MKRIILVGLVFMAQFTFAQTTIALGDFTDLKVFDKLSVTLIASNENKAEITGTSQSKVEIVNKNGLLKIRMPLTKMMTGDEAKVTLYFKKIQSIDANEGSSVICADTFKQTTFDLGTQEGAQITVSLDVDKTSIKAFSGGIVTVTGKAVTQSVSINSGGILKANELETSQTTVHISAGGSADIKASMLVDAKVKAGGTVTIYGKPKELRQETLMGGSIIQK
ncbi:MAG TPA: head GIN domain-containing protein [Flavobacterium sp.]|uniref:head GIN domain-containing protein n=1 Tax=Flavobacterium sp. TaxID=239 RepID=UPI002DBE3FE9|nr:head GIN domain-containing protein [Flavobacterium sp.]HEU4791615.1 head GIN domain-containing protein [Flavobacterium sp.]